MIDMKFKLFVLKKVGVLPDISYKPVFEREFVLDITPGSHVDLEVILCSFRTLFPDRDVYKVTIEY